MIVTTIGWSLSRFTSSKSFSALPINFIVAPGGSQEVKVTFTPMAEDTMFEFLALPNNDPSEQSVGIPLEGLGIPTGVNNNFTNLGPQDYRLEQNYPNPFNPSTCINFTIKKTDHVKLVVYNMLGEEIEILVDKQINAGSHEINWAPANLTSGMYF